MQTVTNLTTVLLVVLLTTAACATSPPVTPAPLPPVPADGFITSGLVIPPVPESAGDVTISVTVTNPGANEATHTIELVIDNAVVEWQEVTLAGGASRRLNFSTFLTAPGTHEVRVGQVSGKLDWIGPN